MILDEYGMLTTFQLGWSTLSGWGDAPLIASKIPSIYVIGKRWPKNSEHYYHSNEHIFCQ